MIIRLVPGDMMVTVLVLLVTELVRFLLVFIFYRFVVFGLVWMSVCFIFLLSILFVECPYLLERANCEILELAWGKAAKPREACLCP